MATKKTRRAIGQEEKTQRPIQEEYQEKLQEGYHKKLPLRKILFSYQCFQQGRQKWRYQADEL